MNVNRRGFMATMLAACAAPAIVKASNLMPMVPTETMILPGTVGWLGAIREIRAYDINRDTFITRWDVAGRLNGNWVQYHVAMPEEEVTPIYFSSRDNPVATRGIRARLQEFPNQRAAAVEKLRDMADSEGLLVVRGHLELPPGVHHARFLA